MTASLLLLLLTMAIVPAAAALITSALHIWMPGRSPYYTPHPHLTQQQHPPARAAPPRLLQEQQQQSLTIIPYVDDFESSVLDACTSIYILTFRKAENPDRCEASQLARVREVLQAKAEHVSVALWDGELAGFVAFQLHADEQSGEILLLGVDPDFRRRGVARALLDHTQDRLRDAGMKVVSVETSGGEDGAGDAPARALYESAGFDVRPAAKKYVREL